MAEQIYTEFLEALEAEDGERAAELAEQLVGLLETKTDADLARQLVAKEVLANDATGSDARTQANTVLRRTNRLRELRSEIALAVDALVEGQFDFDRAAASASDLRDVRNETDTAYDALRASDAVSKLDPLLSVTGGETTVVPRSGDNGTDTESSVTELTVRNVGGTPTAELPVTVETTLDGLQTPETVGPVHPGERQRLPISVVGATTTGRFDVTVQVGSGAVGGVASFDVVVAATGEYLADALRLLTAFRDRLVSTASEFDGSLRSSITDTESVIGTLETINTGLENGSVSTEEANTALADAVETLRVVSNRLATKQSLSDGRRTALRSQLAGVIDTLERAVGAGGGLTELIELRTAFDDLRGNAADASPLVGSVPEISLPADGPVTVEVGVDVTDDAYTVTPAVSTSETTAASVTVSGAETPGPARTEAVLAGAAVLLRAAEFASGVPERVLLAEFETVLRRLADGLSVSSNEEFVTATTDRDSDLADVVRTADGLYAVGGSGTVLRRGADGWETVVSQGPTGGGNNLRAADATDDGRVLWVAGASGVLGAYDVTTDELADLSQPGGVTNNFSTVSVTGRAGEANVYLADDSGVVYTSFDNGAPQTFAETVPGDGSAVNAMEFHGQRAGHLVDGATRVFATEDGETWSEIGVDAGVDLYGLSSTAADDVWLCGDSGQLFHYDGSGFHSETVSSVSFSAIDVDDTAAVAAGGSGVVAERTPTDGEWRVVSTPTGQNLKSAIADTFTVSVGAGGTVLEHAPGERNGSVVSSLKAVAELTADVRRIRRQR